MNKWIFLLVGLVFFASFAEASVAVKKNSPMQFMFVIDSAKGQLKRIDAKTYQLTLPVRSIHSVLAFSDRPNRVHFRLSPDEYGKLVYVGRNSFTDDPPNIVLVWGGQHSRSIVYHLLSHQRSGGNIIYTLAQQPQIQSSRNVYAGSKSGRVVLFVDPVTIRELRICSNIVPVRPALHDQSIGSIKEQLRQTINQQVPVCSYER